MVTNPSRDIVKEIMAASSMGFDYVELNIEIPEGHPEILKRKHHAILEALKSFDHIPVGHNPYWSELWSDYEEVRQAWIRVGRRSIDIAASLGCGKLNFHAPILHGMYKYVEVYKKRALKNTMNSLNKLVRYASSKKVFLVFENMPELEFMRFKEYSLIMKKVPGLKAHIDVSHAFVEGGMRMVSRYIKTFQKRLEHIHFSDSLGMTDDHLGIGQGIINYERVMRLLRRIRYDKTITLEIFSGKKDLRNSLKLIRAMEDKIW
jgi:sugar phosphate isomerase/epimerase